MVTNEEDFAAGDDTGTEISLGLNDGTDSEYEEDSSPRANRLLNEQADPVSETADAAAPTAAKGSAPPAKGSDVDCRRCKDPTSFGGHAPGCPKKEVFLRYAECPRCRAVITSRNGWRKHQLACFARIAGGNHDQRRNFFSVTKYIRDSPRAMKLERCGNCSVYRHYSVKLLAVHEVLCRGQGGGTPAPSLPAGDELCERDGKVDMSLRFALRVKKVFTEKENLRVSTKLGFLWLTVERIVTCAPAQTVGPTCGKKRSPSPPSRAHRKKLKSVVAQPHPTVTSKERGRRPAIPHGFNKPRRMRSDADFAIGAREYHRAMATAGGTPTEDARTRTVPVTITRVGPATAVVTPTMTRVRLSENPLCTPPTGRSEVSPPPPPPPPPPAGSKETSPTERAVAAALAQPSTWSPDKQRKPASDVIAENRDRFKIRLPGGLWVDAYGRSTSPRREARKNYSRPAPSMTGLLVSVHQYRPPTYVCADGHIASGWGRLHTPDGKTHAAYKEAPGDVTPVPDAAKAMAHYVPFFLTTRFGNVRFPAGPLHFDVDISSYTAVGYSAAGARSTITISLNPPGGQE